MTETISLDDLSQTIELEKKNIESEKEDRIKESVGIGDRQDGIDKSFQNLEKRLMGRIKNLEQIIKGDAMADDEYDLVRPYERDVSAETRPQMSGAGLSQHNKHLSQLTNHELHQMKSIHQKDHRKQIKTILDEPLGNILDKTLNFLVHSFDSYTEKVYEAELMENVNDKDNKSYIRFKIHFMAIILFARDDNNIIYIGFFMIFLSIIIYFINIITTAG